MIILLLQNNCGSRIVLLVVLCKGQVSHIIKSMYLMLVFIFGTQIKSNKKYNSGSPDGLQNSWAATKHTKRHFS